MKSVFEKYKKEQHLIPLINFIWKIHISRFVCLQDSRLVSEMHWYNKVYSRDQNTVKNLFLLFLEVWFYGLLPPNNGFICMADI